MGDAKQFVGVRLPEHLIEAAKLVAESEHRTLSNYILTLVAEDIARRQTTGIALREESEPYIPPRPSKRASSKAQKAG